MGIRARKTFKAGPVRMTVSKSGVSTSIGVKGVRVGKMANGKTRTTVSVPGTGISYVTESKKKEPAELPLDPSTRTPPIWFRFMGVLSVVLAAMLLILALLWWPSLIFAAFFFWLGVKLVKNAKSYSGQSILRDISGADLDDDEKIKKRRPSGKGQRFEAACYICFVLLLEQGRAVHGQLT